MSSLICKSCGKIYYSDGGHCCKHDDCLVSRISGISSNYRFFTREKGKIQEISFVPCEFHHKLSFYNFDFYSLNRTPITADGSKTFPTYQANMNIEKESPVKFYRPTFMSTSIWNANTRFPFPSQNESYAVPKCLPFIHRPVCFTPIHNDNQMILGPTSDINQGTERSTDIQVSKISSGVFENQNQSEADNTRFSSTPRKLSDDPQNDEPEVAGPSRSRHNRWICPECGKRFSKQFLLKRHSVVHSGEKMFACHICHKSYKQKCYLKIHILIHKGIKSHKCGECGKAFTMKCTLKVHMRIHTGEKSFK